MALLIQVNITLRSSLPMLSSKPHLPQNVPQKLNRNNMNLNYKNGILQHISQFECKSSDRKDFIRLLLIAKIISKDIAALILAYEFRAFLPSLPVYVQPSRGVETL